MERTRELHFSPSIGGGGGWLAATTDAVQHNIETLKWKMAEWSEVKSWRSDSWLDGCCLLNTVPVPTNRIQLYYRLHNTTQYTERKLRHCHSATHNLNQAKGISTTQHNISITSHGTLCFPFFHSSHSMRTRLTAKLNCQFQYAPIGNRSISNIENVN